MFPKQDKGNQAVLATDAGAEPYRVEAEAEAKSDQEDEQVAAHDCSDAEPENLSVRDCSSDAATDSDSETQAQVVDPDNHEAPEGAVQAAVTADAPPHAAAAEPEPSAPVALRPAAPGDADRADGGALAPAEVPGADRVPRGPKDMHSTVHFRIPEGILRFYPQHKIITAFCNQHENCRRSRTVVANSACKTAMQKGQGRPAGMLMAWLQLGDAFPTTYAHVHESEPTAGERLAARENLYALTGGKDFAEKAERPLRPGEADEPARIR